VWLRMLGINCLFFDYLACALIPFLVGETVL
jgi:hypothetical protein